MSTVADRPRARAAASASSAARARAGTRPAPRAGSRAPARTATRPAPVSLRRRRAPFRARSAYGRPSVWKAGRPTVRIVVVFSVCTALLVGTVVRVAMLATVDRARYAA